MALSNLYGILSLFHYQNQSNIWAFSYKLVYNCNLYVQWHLLSMHDIKHLILCYAISIENVWSIYEMWGGNRSDVD